MKNENKIINKGGVGFCGLLTIVLIGLKVASVTDMSWFWVFSPMILIVILIMLLLISLYILLK